MEVQIAKVNALSKTPWSSDVAGMDNIAGVKVQDKDGLAQRACFFVSPPRRDLLLVGLSSGV